MKRIFITLLFLLPLAVMAQLTFDLDGKVTRHISRDLREGASVSLESMQLGIRGTSSDITVLSEGKEFIVNASYLTHIKFSQENIQQFWQLKALNNGVYDNISTHGLQFKLRKELEEEALEYLSYLESNDLLFKDSYLESYLHSLAFRIYPARLEDGRPGILNIKILKDSSPNAFIFPNGTLLISTGLLSTIHSEQELIGVLAHEVAHFVLDHSVININAVQERQRKAEFWAAFATGVAAAVDIYAAGQNAYYIPGNLTLSTAAVAYSIAESATQRFGLQYSRTQEVKADKCAADLMSFIKVDPTALSSALSKIKQYAVLSGNYYALSGEGSHPAIQERIEAVGRPNRNFSDVSYDRKISFVNSFNAIMAFNQKHFETAASLINRNINALVAIEEDFVILAAVTMNMYDTEEKNLEALGLINRAKTLNVYPTINLSKQEAIALIRLGRNAEAQKSLEAYQDALNSQWDKVNNIQNENFNSALRIYLTEEEEWAIKMIHKVSLL